MDSNLGGWFQMLFIGMISNPHHEPLFLEPVTRLTATSALASVRIDPMYVQVAASRKELAHRNLRNLQVRKFDLLILRDLVDTLGRRFGFLTDG